MTCFCINLKTDGFGPFVQTLCGSTDRAKVVWNGVDCLECHRMRCFQETGIDVLHAELADARAEVTKASDVVNSAKGYMVHSDDCLTPIGRCDCGLDIWFEKAMAIDGKK